MNPAAIAALGFAAVSVGLAIALWFERRRIGKVEKSEALAKQDTTDARRERDDAVRAQKRTDESARDDRNRLNRVIAEKDRKVEELRNEIGIILGECADASAGAAAVAAYLDGVLAVSTSGRAGDRDRDETMPLGRP